MRYCFSGKFQAALCGAAVHHFCAQRRALYVAVTASLVAIQAYVELQYLSDATFQLACASLLNPTGKSKLRHAQLPLLLY